MTLDPAAIAAIASAAGVVAGYAIKLAELWLHRRAQTAEAYATRQKTALNGYAGLTDRLQARLTCVEAQLDATNQRLTTALDRIDELEADNRRLNTELDAARAEIAILKRGAPCPSNPTSSST